MPKYKFVRTVQYAEIIEVEAASVAEAKVSAYESEADGERIHDDMVISVEYSKNQNYENS